jgi:hypothetical protein
MRRNIVEGEPGIFPAPIASVLRAFGRLFRRDKRAQEEPQQDDEAEAPPRPDSE